MKKGIYDGLKGVFKMLIEDNKLVRLFNRLKQTFSLFIGGQQLYFQREFHNAKIQLFQVQENILFTLKALGVVAYLPPTLRKKIYFAYSSIICIFVV